MPTMPNVVGLEYQAALTAMMAAGVRVVPLGYFQIDPVAIRWRPSLTSAPGVVLIQSPAAGATNVAANAAVNLVVSNFALGIASDPGVAGADLPPPGPPPPPPITTTFDSTKTTSNQTLSNGKLTVAQSSQASGGTISTVSYSSGKRYVELTLNQNQGSTGNFFVGVADSGYNQNAADPRMGIETNTLGYANASGIVYTSGTGGSTFATYGAGDVVGLAIDLGAKTVQLFKNNVSQGTVSFTGTAPFFVGASAQAGSGGQTSQGTINFGATNFVYSPPAGFTGGW